MGTSEFVERALGLEGESDYTNVADLPADETWGFSLEALLYSSDPRPDIADYEVTLASGF